MSRATRSESDTATAARAPKISTRRRSLVGEARVAAELVVHGDHAERDAARDERHVKARSAPRAARASSWATSGSSSSESTRALCRRCSTRPAFDRVAAQAVPEERFGSGLDALDRGDLEVAVRAPASAIERDARADQLAHARADELRAAGRARSRSTIERTTSCSDSSWRDQRVADS